LLSLELLRMFPQPVSLGISMAGSIRQETPGQRPTSQKLKRRQLGGM
jgi:hypothetical protein